METKIRKISATIAAIALMASVATGCSTADTNAGLVGGALGAGTAVVLGGNVESVLLGTAAGAAAGVVIGRVARDSNQCYYANGRGGYYKARC